MNHPEHYLIKWLLDDWREYPIFTTAKFVEWYVDWRTPRGWNTPWKLRDVGWVEMNARNCLTAAVQLGILVRVRRGIYIWSKR